MRISGTPPPTGVGATRLAEQLILGRDPELVRFILSHDRTPDPARDAALIAERLSELGLTTIEHLIAAVATLEANSIWQEREIARLVDELERVESRSITRLGATGVAVGVLVAGVAVLAGVAQVLQYFNGG